VGVLFFHEADMDEKSGNFEVAPAARIIQQFLCFMVALMLVTLAVGQLKLPFYGATLWDLGAAMLEQGYDWVRALAPAVADAVSERFPVVIGALGVLWLATIHVRVQQTGRYALGALDLLFAGCALGGLIVYFYFLERILPLNATFFYRVALYCSVAVLTFGVSVAASALSDKLERTVGGEVWPVVLLLIGGIVIAIATSVQGEGFCFSGMNVVLHLVANLGAVVMGVAYEGRVSFIARQRDNAKAKAEHAAASAE
jgi:hypothetical protein